MSEIGSFSSSGIMTMARGRNGDLYGVNGVERGFRWDGITASVEQLGISAPAAPPTVTASTGTPKYYLQAIDVVDPGFCYTKEPTVSIQSPASGVTAKAKAELLGTGVRRIVMQDYGTGYTSEPTITLSAPDGSTAHGTGATFSVTLSGSIADVRMLAIGTGYTAEPTVKAASPCTGDAGTDFVTCTSHGFVDGDIARFHSLTGGGGLSANVNYYVVNSTADTFQVALTSGGTPINLTSALTAGQVFVPPGGGLGALLLALFDSVNGLVREIIVANPGDGYVTPPAIYIDPPPTAPTNVQARASCTLSLGVSAVSVLTGGSGYRGRPRLKFSSTSGGGAVAEATVSSGAISSVTVFAPGSYRVAPTVTVEPDPRLDRRAALVRPVLTPGIVGRFWCAYRYVDDTSTPVPSSISALAPIEVTTPSESLQWSGLSAGTEPRVSKIELWRTSADQALTLYRVATINANVTSYTDTLSDAELTNPERSGFQSMAIVLPNGQPNARRFRPPPQNKSSIIMFQDRAWYGVDVAGRSYDGQSVATAAEPNKLYFSEIDEPESVPEPNELILQDNVNGADRVTALMPFAGAMIVFQERHCYRLSYASQPIIDASISLIGQRGCLNQRCFDLSSGIAYVADSSGIYVLDGSSASPISDAVEPFWSDEIIHFGSSKNFYLKVDPVTGIVRFHFSITAGFPDRALCYHPLTKSWWVEVYAQPFGASCVARSNGRPRLVAGAASGSLHLFDSGGTDATASGTSSISCQYRTGTYPLAIGGNDRRIRVIYAPTAADATLTARLHFNNSSIPRPSAVNTDRGTGFVTEPGGGASLNLKSSRSALGAATGHAYCNYSGRLDDWSAGGDRHLALDLTLARPSSEQAILYGVAIEGVGT